MTVVVKKKDKSDVKVQDKPLKGFAKFIDNQSIDALQRGLKYAAKTDLDEVKYRGVMVPLLSHQNAMKGVKAGELYEAKSLGVWVYHGSPVGDDYAAIPKYILADLPQPELNKFANRVGFDIIENKASVDKIFDDIRQQLNAHQAKWVTDSIVKLLSEARTAKTHDSAMAQAKATDLRQQANDLIKDGHHFASQAWNSSSPTAERSLMGAAHQTTAKAKKADAEADTVDAERDQLQKQVADLTEQMGQMMAMMKDLKND